MRTRIAFLLLLVACGGPKGEPPADAVATNRQGAVTFAAIEPLVRTAIAGQPAPEHEKLVEAYLHAAEDWTVEHALLPGPADLDRALTALGDEREKMHRDAVVELYLQESLRPDLGVSEAEVVAYFEAHRDRFHRPGQRAVWHLFRRHEDPAHPEVTMAFVESLRQRIAAGESFTDLAREYSQSETRLLGGRLGMVGRGKLPPKLEEIVFSLPEGEVSAPISSRQGVFLFRVADAIPDRTFPLADVRLAIARELRDEKLRQALAAAAADEQLPAGARVLDAETLRRAPALGDDEVVLEVGGYRLTVSEVREMLAERRRNAPPSLEPGRDMEHFYETLVLRQRLYAKAVREGFVPRRQAAIDALEQRLGGERWLHQELERRMWEQVDRKADERQSFYDDNRFLYQTPLRLELVVLSAPLGDDPAGRLQRLEGLRRELEAGTTDLAAAAGALGGSVREAGWASAADLAKFEPKVRYYLLDMSGTGYTIPFQLNRQLTLVQVAAREEPRQRPYDEVEDRVRQDYYDRHQQDLYRQVVEEILAGADFRFQREAVLARLGAPACAPSRRLGP